MVCMEKHTKSGKVENGMHEKAYQKWESGKWYDVKCIPKVGKWKMVCKLMHTKTEKVKIGMKKRAYQNRESQNWYA